MTSDQGPQPGCQPNPSFHSNQGCQHQPPSKSYFDKLSISELSDYGLPPLIFFIIYTPYIIQEPEISPTLVGSSLSLRALFITNQLVILARSEQ